MNLSPAQTEPKRLSLPARILPGCIPPGQEIFAIGDVHGQADLLAGVLDEIVNIPRSPVTKRVIVFLGDLIDRGPDSPGAVALAMNAVNLAAADEVVMLPGNHELAFLDALEPGADPHSWLQNGGKDVIGALQPDWQSKPWAECQDILRAAFPAEWISALKSAPSHLILGDLLFVHAGLNPSADRHAFLNRARTMDEDHWATIRNTFLLWQGGWDIDPVSDALTRGPTVVVHGHTPALRVHAKIEADLEPMDGIDDFRCVCLDAGAAFKPQLGWARFWIDGGRSQVSVSVLVRQES